MSKIPTELATLLLLLSREKIEPSQYDCIMTLCDRVSDWPLFISLAAQKFILPMAYRHLTLIKPKGLLKSDYERMHSVALSMTMMTLKLYGAQTNFVEKCLVPLNCNYSILKGIGLAQRYYKDPGLRFARDIDVLVPSKKIESVIRIALSRGYKVKIAADKLDDAPDERALRALLRYDHIISLLSPEAVWIEVHTQVDYGLGLFNPPDLLSSPSQIKMNQGSIQIPNTPELFSFICYHSARHTWSRLHWLADLDAMINHPSFVLNEVLEYANRIGTAPAVKASIEFNNLTKNAHLMRPRENIDPHAQALLNLCLTNLEGNLELELELRGKLNALALPFYWLLTPKVSVLAFLRRTRTRFTPSYYQFEMWPLPDRLQWLYYPTKPIFAWVHSRS